MVWILYFRNLKVFVAFQSLDYDNCNRIMILWYTDQNCGSLRRIDLVMDMYNGSKNTIFFAYSDPGTQKPQLIVWMILYTCQKNPLGNCFLNVALKLWKERGDIFQWSVYEMIDIQNDNEKFYYQDVLEHLIGWNIRGRAGILP